MKSPAPVVNRLSSWWSVHSAFHASRSIWPAGMIALSLVLATACGPGTARDRLIAVDGSSTVFPISEAVAEEYQRAHPGVRITVGISGTGGGFSKFCRGETDATGASRPIDPVEIQTCERSGIAFTEVPIAYDGLTVVVHPNNTWVDHMTVSELKRLWEPAAQGTVRRWSDVRPGWPDREIRLFGPGVDSGTFDYFTEAIVGKEKASRGDFTSSEDDNVLVQGVANDELALGFFGYAYYEENRDRLRAVPIDDERDDNGVGPVAASPETVRDGTYQPLARPLLLYVSHRAIDRPEVQGFVNYYLEEGEMLVREVGYVSLTDREYELARQRVAAGVPGTMFETERMPGASLEVLMSRSR